MIEPIEQARASKAQRKKEYTDGEMEALRLCLDTKTGRIKKPITEIMADLRSAGGIKRSEKKVTDKIKKMKFSVAL